MQRVLGILAAMAMAMAMVNMVTVVPLAQIVPDFSGTWTLDRDRSDDPPRMGGGGRGGGGGRRGGGGGGRRGPGAGGPMGGLMELADTVVIEQTESQLSVLVGERRVELRLDGAESTNGGPRGDVVTTSRWEGVALVTTGRVEMSTPRGEITIETEEIRSLSEDGVEMTVKTTAMTPRGERSFTRVYAKTVE